MESFILIVFLAFCHLVNAGVFTLKMHHRFSEPMQRWSEEFTAGDFPAKGSVEYHSDLADIDMVLDRRRLFDSGDDRFNLSDGSSSFRISSLGFLYYTTISMGTPAKKFMVALDTRSDLFWVPCAYYNSDFKLSIYNPARSSSNQNTSCNHSMCTNRHQCSGSDTCPYSVSYDSSKTSTSGILMEDLLHLETEDSYDDVINASVTFGCGQVESGSFLDIAAPNGLFGLGLENISVPTVLSRQGYTANAFSMCFGHDGTGSISFGDIGSVDQEVTPFIVDALHPTYDIMVKEFHFGASRIDSSFTALFHPGSSFTYLTEPHYTRLTQKFHAQTEDSRHLEDQRIPFEYCYDMSPDANTSLIPSMSLTMKGEGQFFIYDPVIIISTNRKLVYCLAVIRSAEVNIIGQNFMTGYRIVFDKELVLGWEKSDCEISTYSSSKSWKPNNVALAFAADHESTRNIGGTWLFYVKVFCYWTQLWMLYLYFLFRLLFTLVWYHTPIGNLIRSL